jgi:PhnB protein
MNQLNPYLFFNGDAAKALRHYEETLGAKSEAVMYYRDGPGCDKLPESAKDGIMHSMLYIGGGVVMVSDSPGVPVTAGSNVQVVLDFDDKDEMVGKFNALAATGKVTMPLEDTFWGAHFGSLVDAFGIHWMFNCMLKRD